MSTSLPIPDDRDRQARDDEPSIYDKYVVFRERNPQLLDLMYGKACEYRDRFGRKKIGIGLLTEVVRWDYMISTGDDSWKINNTYGAYLVRDLILRDPSLADLFELRASAADRHFSIVRIAGPGSGVVLSREITEPEWPGADSPGDEGGLW